jgi:uncharacterized membrane protein required for colicin V production
MQRNRIVGVIVAVLAIIALSALVSYATARLTVSGMQRQWVQASTKDLKDLMP